MTYPIRDSEPTGNIQCGAMRGSILKFDRYYTRANDPAMRYFDLSNLRDTLILQPAGGRPWMLQSRRRDAHQQN
jgi:hypothetical protein